jgi:hypothetical protein
LRLEPRDELKENQTKRLHCAALIGIKNQRFIFVDFKKSTFCHNRPKKKGIKIMKRKLGTILALLALTALFTACGVRNEEKQESKKQESEAQESVKQEMAKLPEEMAAPPTATPKSEFKIFVNCGASENYTDEDGNVWLADAVLRTGLEWGAKGGETVVRDARETTGTTAPKVFLSERYGMTGYEFTVPEGKYKVCLHFAETYDGIVAAGERVFSVKINGAEALTDVDPFKETGDIFRPLVKCVSDVAPVDGKIVIEFVEKMQSAQVCGIKIVGM